MHLGQTVFYRIDKSDQSALSGKRTSVANVKYGDIFPATIIRMHQTGNGVLADLTVHLPQTVEIYLEDCTEEYEVTTDRQSGFRPVPGSFAQAVPLEAEM